MWMWMECQTDNKSIIYQVNMVAFWQAWPVRNENIVRVTTIFCKTLRKSISKAENGWPKGIPDKNVVQIVWQLGLDKSLINLWWCTKTLKWVCHNEKWEHKCFIIGSFNSSPLVSSSLFPFTKFGRKQIRFTQSIACVYVSALI